MFLPSPAPRPSSTPSRSPGRGPDSSEARSQSAADCAATRVTLEGLTGTVELRRAPGGHLEVWPRPSPESQRALYAEQFYEQDKASYLDDVSRDRAYWDAIWSIRRRMIERLVPSSAGRVRRILDVGASGGFLLDHFQQHGWVGLGIEPSKSAARHARERFGLEMFCGALLDFAFGTDGDGRGGGGEPFDAVHCAQVLEHVLEPEACVARIASLLRPGGVVFVEVPNDFNALQEAARVTLAKPAWWVAPDHHLNYFDAASLAALLARHGLVEVDRVASFPIELFLLMGDDYVGHPTVGRACHERRMRFERALIDAGRIDALADLYRGLARSGLGRTVGILARKPG